MNTPSGSGSDKVPLEYIVTLHLTLLSGPRSILERHNIYSDKDLAATADADARSVHTLTQVTRGNFFFWNSIK